MGDVIPDVSMMSSPGQPIKIMIFIIKKENLVLLMGFGRYERGNGKWATYTMRVVFLFFYSLIFLSHFLVFVLSSFSFSPFEPISNFYYSIQILVWSHYFNFKMHNQNFSMNTTIVICLYIYT
jgi:hypothetical protein